MSFFGSGVAHNDPDRQKVVTDNRTMRQAIKLALEIAADKKELGENELASLRLVLRNGLSR